MQVWGGRWVARGFGGALLPTRLNKGDIEKEGGCWLEYKKWIDREIEIVLPERQPQELVTRHVGIKMMSTS
jgi:hypothetical protein